MFTIKSLMGVAPMAGMTDSALRRLVKRQGGCGLVVSEMVSSEGLVRGIDRTLEYLDYTEEERPVAIQLFGGDPQAMAAAAVIVESRGADVVDINMGCPVPKIAKHHAGCSLMREPEQAAAIVAAMVQAVKIPVTVKMRAGWNDHLVNAPELARAVEAAGASAVAVHGRTAEQAYHGQADWELIGRVARAVSIPVLGCGDLLEPEQIVERLRTTPVAGVLVGRGILRNPWLFAQATDLLAGRAPLVVSREDRGRFLLDYIDLLEAEGPPVVALDDRAENTPLSGFGAENLPRSCFDDNNQSRIDFGDENKSGSYFAGVGAGAGAGDDAGSGRARAGRRRSAAPRASYERWIVNKLRALCAYYTKGIEGGGTLRVAVNQAPNVAAVRSLITKFFGIG
jgi:tRNA-dihydrouridine synthase B